MEITRGSFDVTNASILAGSCFASFEMHTEPSLWEMLLT